MISISPLSAFFTYVVIFHLRLHMVFTSHLIRYARDCLTCDEFLIRGGLLTNRLMSQGFIRATFRKFYGSYNDLVCQYNLPLGQMLSDLFHINRYHS
jgi:hypothetical protein